MKRDLGKEEGKWREWREKANNRERMTRVGVERSDQ